GQQERIALARALYHKRDLLVLDDPFSAVDKRTESLIMQNIKELCADSSVLLISHRLSLFPSFDKIVFIDQSGKVFVGTHPELMDSSSSYRALVNLQSGAAKKND
ncbi:MAG: ABC transporter ATP-binding protein, partial [Treponema sp.]|nr:ABC transporter ATP-binding protein [Treponema sp.]